MTAIQSTTAGVKDMADGSLRITFEFEPRHAAAAFAMFGPRGTPCAVAALTPAAAIQAAQQETIASAPAEEKIKPGPLCIMACNFCKDPKFLEWVNATFLPVKEARFEQADMRLFLLDTCDIESRVELDQIKDKGAYFLKYIREPFMKWRGV